jgi:glycosyltransferase involved in cell wall biosynthesis
MSTNYTKSIRILGCRGIPAKHGGFETFAEYLSLYLLKLGWKVTVYCQVKGKGGAKNDNWLGIDRINIPVNSDTPMSTVIFDFKSVLHASNYNDICLTLGYNTAIFNIVFRLKGVMNITNMDGIEWKRAKWNLIAKSWFWFNEKFACLVSNHLIADNPKIKEHLIKVVSPKKVSMIPYGADENLDTDVSILDTFGLVPYEYITVIARPEPENSLFEIVRSYSSKKRGKKLVILGKYEPSKKDYHKKVVDQAGFEVIFMGAIYENIVINTLRVYSFAYIHGHQVGGTNPSLIEAMSAGNAVIAHGNDFNRWVLGEKALYFLNETDLSNALDILFLKADLLKLMRVSSKNRFLNYFKWDIVLNDYKVLLEKFIYSKKIKNYNL